MPAAELCWGIVAEAGTVMLVEVGPHAAVTVKGPIVTTDGSSEPPDVVTVKEN
jgi:hypothetical protein